MEIQFDDLSIPDINTEYYCSPTTRSTGFSLLMKLVLMANKQPTAIPIIENLIKDPTELNRVNNIGWSALIIACRNSGTYSNNYVVQILVNAGSDVNAEDHQGYTALMLASISSTVETIKMLINAGADVNHTNNYQKSALHIVIRNSMAYDYFSTDQIVKIIKYFVSAGVNLDYKCDGYTVLMKSVYWPDIINLLMGAGADTNLKNNNDRTVLMILFESRVDKTYTDIIIELLGSSKETLFDTDISGKTAYDYYVENNYDILDSHHLKILNGEIRQSATKSARSQ